MKILIIGGGGREHAIAWHFKQDPRVSELYLAPGNAGTAALGTNLPIPATDLPALLNWAQTMKPDLTFVGPEAPLCAGIVDLFEKAGLPIFGPNQKAAQFEGSKVFAKQIFQTYHIPTGRGECFAQAADAHRYSQKHAFPQVIKADGLAAGKGVIIAQNRDEASHAIDAMMEKRIFGDSGAQIVIEECLTGPEISVIAITDGLSYQLLPLAQDHKRIGDHDTGANTGGMGAYAPARFLTAAMEKTIREKILDPLFVALRSEGIGYQGILYAGLMLTDHGPKILEINSRLGDPEAEVQLPLLETPLYDIALAVRRRELSELEIQFSKKTAVGIVLAAPGYPEKPETGGLIEGLEKHVENGFVFHAGTKKEGGKTVTSGGRVLVVTAWDDDFETARRHAYAAAKAIHFPGMQYRRDIGAKNKAS